MSANVEIRSIDGAVGDVPPRSEICRDILRDLPEWFGIPEAVERYARAADDMDMLLAVVDERVTGFASLRPTSALAAEIFVIGVRPAHHRGGIGRALVGAAVRWTAERGPHYLTVKTLGPSRPDPNYDGTRRFYESLGFEPLEELDGLWPGNPCLLMIKQLPSGRRSG